MFLGDFPEDFTTVTCMFTTHAADGSPVAPSSAFEAADVIIYKNGSGTQKTSTNGVTMTSPFDSIAGLHCVVIDTSNDTGDGGFWVTGAQYTLVLSPDETVDSVAVAKVIGTFGIALAGIATAASITALDGKIDTIDSNVDDILVDTAEIGAAGAGLTNINLPNQTMDIVGNITGNLSGSVGSVTGAIGSVAAGGITAGSFAANAINAAKLDPDVTTELQSGLATAAALTTVDGKIDTIDSNVDAVLADTGELQTDWADGGRLDLILDARASQTSVDDLPTNAELTTALGSADDAVLAQVALVKATTDKLDDTLEDDGGTYRFTTNALEQGPGGGSAPTVSEIADEVQTRTIAAVTLVNGLAANTVTASALAADAVTEIQSGLATAATLATVAGYIDTEVAAILAAVDTEVGAIKDQTDKLTFDGDNHVVVDVRKLSTSATAADNLEAGATGLVVSTCAAGSTTTSIVTNLVETTNDHLNGRVITFISGALAGQSSSITDYNGTTKTLTVVALTEAPAEDVQFVIS